MATSRNSTSDSEVVDINSAVDLDLDAGGDEQVPVYPPFRVRLGGKTWTIEQPDAGLVMELEAATTSQAFFALAFDEQWPDVRPLLMAVKDPRKLFRLAKDFGEHFDLSNERIMEAAAGNRAERRRRASVRRR